MKRIAMRFWLVLLGSSLSAAYAPSALQRASEQEERAAVTASNVSAVVGAPSHEPLAGDRLDAATKNVSSLLRCPVCQGLSVWDSPATMAVSMKREVRELLAAGYDEDQILRYFEHSYGEFVRLAPAKNGIALVVWLMPVLLLLWGSVAVWRRTSRTRADEPEREQGSIDPELAKYVQAVRALASDTEGDR